MTGCKLPKPRPNVPNSLTMQETRLSYVCDTVKFVTTFFLLPKITQTTHPSPLKGRPLKYLDFNLYK